MRNVFALAFVALVLASPTSAAEPCPITLLSGTGESDAFTVTFRIRGKLPVRRLEFNCTQIRRQAVQSQSSHCVEQNSYFLSGNEYTVRYGYPSGKPGAVTVSLKSALLANGLSWKPLKSERCRVLRIQPQKANK